MFCDDISAGASAYPIPAIIDNPHGMLMSSDAAPPINVFTYKDDPGSLRVTPAAREFLTRAYPASKPASIWAGCKWTDLPEAIQPSALLCVVP